MYWKHILHIDITFWVSYLFHNWFLMFKMHEELMWPSERSSITCFWSFCAHLEFDILAQDLRKFRFLLVYLSWSASILYIYSYLYLCTIFLSTDMSLSNHVSIFVNSSCYLQGTQILLNCYFCKYKGPGAKRRGHN